MYTHTNSHTKTNPGHTNADANDYRRLRSFFHYTVPNSFDSTSSFSLDFKLFVAIGHDVVIFTSLIQSSGAVYEYINY